MQEINELMLEKMRRRYYWQDEEVERPAKKEKPEDESEVDKQ